MVLFALVFEPKTLNFLEAYKMTDFFKIINNLKILLLPHVIVQFVKCQDELTLLRQSAHFQ